MIVKDLVLFNENDVESEEFSSEVAVKVWDSVDVELNAAPAEPTQIPVIKQEKIITAEKSTVQTLIWYLKVIWKPSSFQARKGLYDEFVWQWMYWWTKQQNEQLFRALKSKYNVVTTLPATGTQEILLIVFSALFSLFLLVSYRGREVF